VVITAAGAPDGIDVTLHVGSDGVRPLPGGDGEDDAGSTHQIPGRGLAAGEVL
jgi:hypothetical protein